MKYAAPNLGVGGYHADGVKNVVREIFTIFVDGLMLLIMSV